MHYPRAEALRAMSLKEYPNCSDMGHVGGVRVWKHQLVLLAATQDVKCQRN